MTIKESLDLLNLIKLYFPVAYTRFSAEEAKGVVVVWHEAFADIPADIMTLALKRYKDTAKNPPTVADMRDELKRIHDETESLLAYPPFVKRLSKAEIERRKHILAVTGQQGYEHRPQPQRLNSGV